MIAVHQKACDIIANCIKGRTEIQEEIEKRVSSEAGPTHTRRTTNTRQVFLRNEK